MYNNSTDGFMLKVSYFLHKLATPFLMIALCFSNASAQQHIEDCESFLDTELTLLCYQHNIVSELQDYWYRLPRGTMVLTISESGQINDLLLYQRWDFTSALPKAYSGYYIDWISLPVPKSAATSPDNYYELLIEILPTGEILALEDMKKRVF